MRTFTFEQCPACGEADLEQLTLRIEGIEKNTPPNRNGVRIIGFGCKTCGGLFDRLGNPEQSVEHVVTHFHD